MLTPNFILLYVQNPTRSAAFYASLIGSQPVETSPTFCMFALPSGMMLGLWERSGVEPVANAVGGSELAFAVADKSAVEATFADWNQRGIKIVQTPTAMDFGFTFTGLDPDGHRLRVFAPGG